MAHPNTGEPVVLTGSAPGTGSAPARVYIANARGKESFAREIEFHNEDGANALRVGFGGTAYLLIAAGEKRKFTAQVSWFTVQSNAVGAVSWRAMAAVA